MLKQSVDNLLQENYHNLLVLIMSGYITLIIIIIYITHAVVTKVYLSRVYCLCPLHGYVQ